MQGMHERSRSLCLEAIQMANRAKEDSQQRFGGSLHIYHHTKIRSHHTVPHDWRVQATGELLVLRLVQHLPGHLEEWVPVLPEACMCCSWSRCAPAKEWHSITPGFSFGICLSLCADDMQVERQQRLRIGCSWNQPHSTTCPSPVLPNGCRYLHLLRNNFFFGTRQ